MNQDAKCLDQRSFSSKVIVLSYRQTDTHNRLIALLGPLKWSAKRTADGNCLCRCTVF